MVKTPKAEYQSIDEVSDVWKILTKDQLKYLKENIIVQNYKKNQIIYCEGDTPTLVYCVVKGKVKIYKTGVGGRSQIVRMVKPFEMLGYRAMFAEEDFVTAACAFEATTIYAIPKAVIRRLISENKDLAWYFIQALAVDLGIADKRAVSLTQKHIRGRLAESLLFLKDSYGVESDGETISIFLSREDLANLSNMTTSNAIRTLSTFVAENLISLDGRKIKIVDEEQLRKISKIG